MGLWDWFVETLAGEKHTSNRSRGTSFRRLKNDAGGGVATLEPAKEGGGDANASAAERWWEVPDGAKTIPEPIERPELSTEARALENVLISHFDGHELELPPLPEVPARVIHRLRNANYESSLVADEISTDQVLAASVIRMANSPLYAGVHKITSLRAAVSRLGANAVRTLMMHQSMRAATFFSKGRRDEVLAGLVWRRALASGWIMRGLSRFTSVDPEEGFVIGLLHDIGSVIVLREVQQQQSILKYKIDVEAFEYLCQECHQEFGELLAERWELPPQLKSLITDHHTYPAPDDPLRTERLMIQLSDMINDMIGYGISASYDLLQSAAVRDLDLPIGGEFCRFLAELPASLELNMSASSI